MLNASQLRSTLQRTLQFDFASGFGLSGPGGAGGSEAAMANSSNGVGEDKARLLLECRAFSSPSIDAHLCCQLVKRLLALLQQQPQLRSDENSSLFFNLTRLFQSSDCRLRRLVYILLRHLRVAPTEAFVVTSCLAKDVAASSGWTRSCALRAFGDLADASAASQLERFIKAALVSPLQQVASAALICSSRLLSSAPEAVKRWTAEVAGAASHHRGPAAAHAVSLLLLLRQTDATARRRCLVESIRQFQMSGNDGTACPLVACLLLRASTAMLHQDGDGKQQELLLRFIESSLKSPHEEVGLEAASSICQLYVAGRSCGFSGFSRCSTYDPSPALQQLRLLLQAPTPVARFGAARVLQRLSLHSSSAPTLIARCSADLESLASDCNRTAAALAVSLLLRAAATGGSSSTEKLLQQASALLLDSSDAIRVEVVKAALEMGLQQPQQQALVVGFLGACLRPEGGLAAKTAATDALMDLLKKRPAAAEACLLQLCEFIEDCEFPTLIGKVLRVLGDEAAAAVAASGANKAGHAPEKLLRCIYNRLLLEGAEVRAAGVCALAKVARAEEHLMRGKHGNKEGADNASLSESQKQRLFLVHTLLKTASCDGDDEVRDRATVFWRALNKRAISSMQLQNEEDSVSDCSTDLSLDDLLDLRSPVSIDCLCDKLYKQLSQPDTAILPFDLRDLPTEDQYLKHKAMLQQTQRSAVGNVVPAPVSPDADSAKTGDGSMGFTTEYDGECALAGLSDEDELLQVAIALTKEVAKGVDKPVSFTTVSRAVSSVRLTEAEAEYAVQLFIHALSASQLLLQFRIANTVEDQQLRQLQVLLQTQEGPWKAEAATAIPVLRCGESGNCFVLLQKADSEDFVLGGLLQAALSFVVCDGEDDSGYEDSYPTEPVAITAAAFLRPLPLRTGEFMKRWAELEAEAPENGGNLSFRDGSKLSLPLRSMRAAVEGLLKELQVAPCEGTERLSGGGNASAAASEPTNHTLLLSGVFGAGEHTTPVLAKARLLLSSQVGGCALLLESRSRSAEAAFALAHCLD